MPDIPDTAGSAKPPPRSDRRQSELTDAEIDAIDNSGAVVAFHLLVYAVIVIGLSTVVVMSSSWIGPIVIFNYSAIGVVPLLICIATTFRRRLRRVVIASACSIGLLLLLVPLLIFTPIGIIVFLFPIVHFLVVPCLDFVPSFTKAPSLAQCANCRYPVDQLTSMQCPECAEPLTALQVRAFRTGVPAGGPPRWLLASKESDGTDPREDEPRAR